MRRHLNTLYVTTENSWLRKDGENIVIRVDKEERGRVPVHLLSSVVCFGTIGVSPALLGHLASSGVCLVFLNRNGRFLARVEGPVSGNVLLRRAQYRVADDEEVSSEFIQSVVAGKLTNQRTVVMRSLRDYADEMSAETEAELRRCASRLRNGARRCLKRENPDELRGLEGEGGRAYFGVFGSLIRNPDSAFEFRGRSRRPPTDPVNCLLSFLYAMLVNDCRSALESVGLDPAVGFLHRDRPGRPSMALDLMEEFRPILADRTALSLVNRRQVGDGDFKSSVGGAVALSDDARKTVIAAYQERKRTEVVHPFLKEKTTFGLAPFLQANLMARWLRGDLDGYPPFLWR